MSEAESEDKTTEPVQEAAPAEEKLGTWRGLFRSKIDWLLAAALVALALPLFSEAQFLAGKKHLQFFPLAVLAGIWLTWSRGVLGTTASGPRIRAGTIFGIVGGIVALASGVLFSPWLAHLAILCLVTAWALVRLGGSSWQQSLAWMTLFWITLPLPMGLDDRLVRKLQSLSTGSASPLMDLAGIPHLPRGNIIEMSAGELFVDEACSGVDSLYALAAVALLLAVWQRSSFATGLLTLLSVPAWAWFGNTLRLFTIAFLLEFYSIDTAHGWKHTVLGLMIFGLTCWCMLVMQTGIQRLLKPFPVKTVMSGPLHAFFNMLVCWPAVDPASERKMAAARKAAAKSGVADEQLSAGGQRLLMALATVVLIAGGASVTTYFMGPAKLETFSSIRVDEAAVVATFEESDLPADLGGMKFVRFETVHRPMSKLFYGEHSAVWHFVDDGVPVHVSLDFPFPGFHALEVCYVGSGREMLEPRKSIDHSDYVAATGGTTQLVEEVQLVDQVFGDAYLCYAEFDRNGDDVWRLGNRLTGSLPARIAHSLQLQPATFQAQIFVNGTDRLLDAERTRYQHMLLDVSRMLLPKIQQLADSE